MRATSSHECWQMLGSLTRGSLRWDMGVWGVVRYNVQIQGTLDVRKIDAIKTLRRHRGDIDVYGVRRIGIFGSHARGDPDEGSDVDILVEFEKATFDNFMDLAFFLEDLFGREVDIVTVDSLSPYIAPRVNSEVVWCD